MALNWYPERLIAFQLSWAIFLNLNITFQVQAPKTLNLNTGTLYFFVKFELALAIKVTARKTELEFRTCTLSISGGDFEIWRPNWHCLD